MSDNERYYAAAKRAYEQGLIPSHRNWPMVCEDCQHRDVDAFAIGPCPSCGGPRAGPDLPSDYTDDTSRLIREVNQLREPVGGA